MLDYHFNNPLEVSDLEMSITTFLNLPENKELLSDDLNIVIEDLKDNSDSHESENMS